MSILNKIKESNVFDFDLLCENEKLCITECRDYYYDVSLNKPEVKALLIELDFIYNQMKEPKQR